MRYWLPNPLVSKALDLKSLAPEWTLLGNQVQTNCTESAPCTGGSHHEKLTTISYIKAPSIDKWNACKCSMSFSMVAGSILFPKFVQLIRNLVLQTNTFSNRQPTKVNLTPTISDQKMRVFVVAGNIKSHMFIQKQDSQNQKENAKNQTTKQILATNKINPINPYWSIYFWGEANKNNNTKFYRRLERGEKSRDRCRLLDPHLGTFKPCERRALLGRRSHFGPTKTEIDGGHGHGGGVGVKDGWAMGFDWLVGFGRLGLKFWYHQFFEYEKGFQVGIWKNLLVWNGLRYLCFARGYLKFLEQKGSFQSLVWNMKWYMAMLWESYVEQYLFSSYPLWFVTERKICQ